jgi:hypothetical protein
MRGKGLPGHAEDELAMLVVSLQPGLHCERVEKAASGERHIDPGTIVAANRRRHAGGCTVPRQRWSASYAAQDLVERLPPQCEPGGRHESANPHQVTTGPDLAACLRPGERLRNRYGRWPCVGQAVVAFPEHVTLFEELSEPGRRRCCLVLCQPAAQIAIDAIGYHEVAILPDIEEDQAVGRDAQCRVRQDVPEHMVGPGWTRCRRGVGPRRRRRSVVAEAGLGLLVDEVEDVLAAALRLDAGDAQIDELDGFDGIAVHGHSPPVAVLRRGEGSARVGIIKRL